MAQLGFNWADMYPNMGVQTTSLMTVANPDDQMAMTDDAELAATHQVKQDNPSNQKIWFGVIAILAIMFAMGVIKS